MATNLTYIPLVGYNLIQSMVNVAGTPDNIKALIASGNTTGRRGKMKVAFTLATTDGDLADDLTVNMEIRSPFPIDPTVTAVQNDQSQYAPRCLISQKSGAVASLPRISSGLAHVVDDEVVIPVQLNFASNNGAASWNIEIDFEHTSVN